MILLALLLGCAGEACEEDPDSARDSVVAVNIEGVPSCLGSVLAPLGEASRWRWVLTAKHCLLPSGEERTPYRDLTVSLGTVVIPVGRVELLGGAYTGLAQLGDDLALLRIDAEYLDTVTGLEWSVPWAGGQDVRAAIGLDIETRRLLDLRLIGTDESFMYTDGVTCVGDSGGPLLGGVCTGEAALVGVASWRTADPCGEGVSVFARIDPHRAWLEGVVAE